MNNNWESGYIAGIEQMMEDIRKGLLRNPKNHKYTFDEIWSLIAGNAKELIEIYKNRK